MIRAIDHLVIACADPDVAASELESSVGIAFTAAGHHKGRGTYNRLSFLADGSYIELIGVDDRELAAANPVGAAAMRSLDESGGGLATYALLEDEIEKAVTALGALGSFGPAVHGSRMRPDGDLVEWWTAFPEGPLAPDGAPFLIQHVYAGAEWGAEAMAARTTFQHPIGSPVGLARLDIAAADPPAAAATIHEQLGIEFWAVADLAVADVGPHVIRIVPRREMALPVTVTLRAAVDAPRALDLLGLRFAVERAGL